MQNEDFIVKSFMDSCYAVMKMNVNTGQIFFYKADGKRCDTPDQPMDGITFVEDFLANGRVYEDDLWEFHLLLEPKQFFENRMHNQSGSILVFRRIEGDDLIWMRLNLMVPSDYSEENPMVLLFARTLQEEEASFYDACDTLAQRLHKVVKMDMMTNQITIIKEDPGETYIRKHWCKLGLSEEIQFAQEGFVHPDDAAAYRRHLDHNYIRNYFLEGNTEYQFYYRRKVGQLYRWVKLMVLPAQEYTPEHPVFFYYVQDVHKALLKIIDMNSAVTYTKFYKGRAGRISDGYYENLLDILSTLIQPYVNFYMIDLEKDLFIQYKIDQTIYDHSVPYVGSYSQFSSNFIRNYFKGKEVEEMQRYSTSKKLQILLKDRTTLEYTFTVNGSRLKTTCIKLESFRGIPRRVLCHTVICPEEKQLIIRTFGNFEVFHPDGTPVAFSRSQSKQLLAYLVDRQGYPITSTDIVTDILHKSTEDKNAVKYVSTLVRRAIEDLTKAGYPDLIVKEQKTLRLDTTKVDCDYYHILKGDITYWPKYHNEYMKEYSWAEETNAEIQNMSR